MLLQFCEHFRNKDSEVYLYLFLPPDFSVVAHERLLEPRVTMEWLLAKPRSFSNLPTFLDLNGAIMVES